MGLELIFNVFKTREFNRSHNTEIVLVVMPMLVVITHHTPVVASVQCMVDVRKVVPSHLTLRIDPNFTSKLTISTLLRDVVRIVDDFSISHDALYHGCCPGGLN
jgi:hypothetical protein